MNVTTLCSLPVGIVRWSAPAPTLTVLVKMTLSLAGDEAALAEAQEPLSLDRPGELGDELSYATDFVPDKARADVLLTGCAYAEPPSRIMSARLRVGSYERCFYAMAGQEASAIPLVAAYLRAEPRPDAAPVSVGPRAAPALADQQLDAIRPGSLLVLEGLLAGVRLRRVRLPDERPRVFLRQAGGAVEVPLRCDTLWIDTTRALCTLTWRGAFPVGADAEPELLVALALPDAPLRWPEVGRVVRAVEASDLEVRAPRVSLEQVAKIRVALWEEGASLAQQLARCGLDELTWYEAVARAEEASRGRVEQASALAEAMEQAKAEASGEEDVRFSLNDYIALRVELDRAEEAEPVLRAHGISAAAWQRMHGAWRARAMADAQVAAKIQAKLAAARKGGGGERMAGAPKVYVGARFKRT